MNPASSDSLRRFDGNGPRNTDQLTIDSFVEVFSAENEVQALKQLRTAATATTLSVSLYVHIPSCESLCYYCACNKIVTKHPGEAEEYLGYLEREAVLHTQPLGLGQSPLHFGAGTPTLMRDPLLRALMGMLRRSFTFTPGGKYSNEIDLRTVGVSRLPVVRGLALSRDDLLRRNPLMALMCQAQFQFYSIELNYLIDFCHYFHAELQALSTLAHRNAVVLADSSIELAADGWFFVRTVAMVFDRYLQADRKRANFYRIV